MRLTADVSDEEVAAEDVGGESLGEIPRADWYQVVMWRPSLIVESCKPLKTMA
jgi:hypothetical protein